jgi:hypothetical protein
MPSLSMNGRKTSRSLFAKSMLEVSYDHTLNLLEIRFWLEAEQRKIQTLVLMLDGTHWCKQKLEIQSYSVVQFLFHDCKRGFQKLEGVVR